MGHNVERRLSRHSSMYTTGSRSRTRQSTSGPASRELFCLLGARAGNAAVSVRRVIRPEQEYRQHIRTIRRNLEASARTLVPTN
jgi:hypothetical protein